MQCNIPNKKIDGMTERRWQVPDASQRADKNQV